MESLCLNTHLDNIKAKRRLFEGRKENSNEEEHGAEEGD